MKRLLLALGVAALSLTGLASAAPTAPPAPPVPLSPTAPLPGVPEAPAAVATLFATMVDALQKNDYLAFVAQGTDAFKAAVTANILKGVTEQLTPRMKDGFTLTYVTDLKQQGTSQYFWKLSFKDGGDEYLISITMRDDKVDGFLMR